MEDFDIGPALRALMAEVKALAARVEALEKGAVAMAPAVAAKAKKPPKGELSGEVKSD